MPSRVGVMGGTFDPIHHGHLVAGEEAWHAFDLDRVLFVPAGVPWQKTSTVVTSAEHRLAMVEAAVDDNEHFESSRIDIDREGATYTIDTLRALQETAPDASLFFITGADAILDILTWKEPEVALSLATFVAVTRPGHDLRQLRSLGVSDRVVVLEIPALAISSTDIRSRVGAGKPIRYLVPRSVEAYIAEHGLYASEA